MDMMTTNSLFTLNNSNSSGELCAHFTKDHLPISRNINIVSAVICIFILLLGTTSTAFVIWIKVYRMEKKFRSVLFFSLFISGFISSLFLLLSIVYFASNLHWPFGSFMCKLASSVFHLNMFISAFIFALLSIDYCIVVMTPLKYNIYRTPHLASKENRIVWIIAICVSIPYMVFKNTCDCDGIIKCLDRFDDSEMTDIYNERRMAMVLMAFILGYGIPFLIIVSCLVITALVYHRKKTSKYTPALKMIFTMQVFFAVCSLPYHVFSLLKLTRITSGEKYIEMVQPITISLASLTSCFNPVLYALVCPEFKKAFSVKSVFCHKQ
ncbi:chemerin-like receptor 1 [Gastrophryne carolinensis]